LGLAVYGQGAGNRHVVEGLVVVGLTAITGHRICTAMVIQPAEASAFGQEQPDCRVNRGGIDPTQQPTERVVCGATNGPCRPLCRATKCGQHGLRSLRRLLNRRRTTNPLDRLTTREREVLGQMAEGHNNPSIA
jgi:hypothetical protein